MVTAHWVRSSLLTAALLSCVGNAAWGASEPGWYYGVSAGQSQADISQTELDEFANLVLATAGTPLSSSSTLEDSDTPWALFFGYQVSRYFAFEAGYLKLGSFPYRLDGTIDLAGPAGSAPSSFGYETEVSGYPVTGLAVLPIGPVFDLHARLGLFFATTEIKLAATAGDASLAQAFSGSSQDVFYGAGVAMNFGQSWSLSLDWAQYKDVGNEDDTAEIDIDSLSLSLIYRLEAF